jgi:hypothetical protein
MADDPGPLTLLLIPEDGNEQSDAWQTECEKLSRVIASAVAEMDIAVRPIPRNIESAGGERSRGSLVTFSNLVISGLSAGVVTPAIGCIWDTLTEWMKRRSGCRCVIKLADGSRFYLENLTKEQALKLLKSRERRTSGIERKRASH